MKEPVATDVVLVSDLHVADGSDRDGFRRDASFSRFIDGLRRRTGADGQTRRLVFLGDFLDFGRVTPIARGASVSRLPLDKLDRMVAAHPAVFAALRRLLADGIAVDVVAGNHDVELARPDVQAGLTAFLAGAGGSALCFHRWQLYLPGLLYAEHGHQYHDVNAFSTVVEPWSAGPDGPAEVTIGAVLDRHGHAGPPGRHAALATGVVGAAARLVDPRRARRRTAYRRRVLPAHARTEGLSPSTAIRLDELSAQYVRAMPRRLADKALASFIGRGRSPALHDMERAASAIHGILAAEGAAVPFYVFGHTHRPGRWLILGGGPPAFCLNTGTWSSRGGRADGRPTFVKVSATGAGPIASVEAWDDRG